MELPYGCNEKLVTMCQLENGEVVLYNMCSPNRNPQSALSYVYLGKGTLYSVNGVRQIGAETLHFFNRAKPENKE